MESNAKNICKTVISANEQNLNKQIVDYFIYLAIFNTFLRSWKPISQFNTFNTLVIPPAVQAPINNAQSSRK